MNGRILLADDEETFLYSTRDLLRRAGYECDVTGDAEGAISSLSQGDYDLLISDIRMAGNGNLELIRQVPEIQSGLPVILVTGYPSLESAIDSIQLPVVAYLVKPFAFDDLLQHTREAIGRWRLYRAVSEARHSLEQWPAELGRVETWMRTQPQSNDTAAGAFLAATLRNISHSLRDIGRLGQALLEPYGNMQPAACQVLNCPRGALLEDLVLQTISVLEKTKTAFKSKELGDLRVRLEKAMADLTAARQVHRPPS